jgi:mono/diheme cytochrome c family protein
MRVSAEFDDVDTAFVAAKMLTDEGEVEADDIEIRSAWPPFEEALPPHLHRPMRIRNFVRFLWVCGAICGYAMVWYCQVDYPIRTSGHPIVPVPLNAIITYECAQITGLIMTTFFFFIETSVFRMRPIPEEEDLAVANGQLAVVVGGPRAEAAKGILEKGGARIVRTFSTLAMTLALLAGLLFTSGCQVRMRTQTGHGVPGWPMDPARAWPIKDTENANVAYDPHIISVPSMKDPDITAMTEPYGRLLEPSELAIQQREHPGRSTPPEVKSFANPTDNTTAAEAHGQQLYSENCIFCHGATGNGDGPVAALYAIPPASLNGTSRKDLLPPGIAPAGQGQTDGDLYWTITVAPPSNVMPAFGAKLPPMDRFYIVRYIRKLQRDAGNPIPPAAASPANMPVVGGSSSTATAKPSDLSSAAPAASGEAPSSGAPAANGEASPSGAPGASSEPPASAAPAESGAPASATPVAPASTAPASGAPQ